MFVDGIAERMGIGVHRRGTSVVAAEDRAGSSTVVAYAISMHTVLWCDPAIVDELSPLADATTARSLSEISAWAKRRDWQGISAVYMQLLGSSGIVRPSGVFADIRSLNRECRV